MDKDKEINQRGRRDIYFNALLYFLCMMMLIILECSISWSF